MYDLIIIGSGAAGLSAGLYAGRYRLKTLLVEGEFGGETSRAGHIANYPGVLPIDGYELMKLMKKQGEEVGTEFRDGWVKSIVKEGDCFTVVVNDDELHTKTIIFAGGAESRRLGLPREDELTGKGVHYCVTCDGPIYTGKTIAIVGGGDSSVKGANLAAEYADKIYIISRDKELHAEPINYEQLMQKGDKIEILYENEVAEIVGEETFEKVILKNEVNGSNELNVDGLFIEIGYKPQTELPASIGVALDERNYINVDNAMATNIEGFFAAGDSVNHFGRFKQVITAAATGSMAATSAYDYSKSHGELCKRHWLPPQKKEE